MRPGRRVPPPRRATPPARPPPSFFRSSFFLSSLEEWMTAPPEQVSWLSLVLLAAPSRSLRNSGLPAAFVAITVAGRRRLRTSFPRSGALPRVSSSYPFSGAARRRPRIASPRRRGHKKSPGLRRARGCRFPSAGVSRPPPIRGGQGRRFGAGLPASGSSYLPRLPVPCGTVAFLRHSSPVTAAGPRRIRTVFPFMAMRPLLPHWIPRKRVSLNRNFPEGGIAADRGSRPARLYTPPEKR